MVIQMERLEITELLIDDLGDMYDEFVARTLSNNTIYEKYSDLSYIELCDKMIDRINAIRQG